MYIKNIGMNKKYTFEKKEKLFKRINKLVEKFSSKNDTVQIKKIKTIIDQKNPSLETMTNNYGFFLNFEDLTDETYDELTKFVSKHEKKILKEKESEMFETSDNHTEEETVTDQYSEQNLSKKLRLTNTENHILNRVKYEEELRKNEECSKEGKTPEKKKTKKKTDPENIFLKADKSPSNKPPKKNKN